MDILTWQGRHHNQKHGFPRARLIYCISDVLTTVISPKCEKLNFIICGTGELCSYFPLVLK